MTTEEELRNVHRLLKETIRMLEEGRTAECREFLETAAENLDRIVDNMKIRKAMS
jgi:hypothetical protein